MISDNRDILDKLARELLEKETLDHNQIAEIFTEVSKLPERPQWLSSEDRPVSLLPPIEMPPARRRGRRGRERGATQPTSRAPAGHRGRRKPRPATA